MVKNVQFTFEPFHLFHHFLNLQIIIVYRWYDNEKCPVYFWIFLSQFLTPTNNQKYTNNMMVKNVQFTFESSHFAFVPEFL